MKEVYIVSNENKDKAGSKLKEDDDVSRGSITIRESKSLNIDEEGYFIIIDGSEEILEKAAQLLEGLANKYDKKESVITVLEEQEDKAVSGLGNIM